MLKWASAVLFEGRLPFQEENAEEIAKVLLFPSDFDEVWDWRQNTEGFLRRLS